MKNICCSICLLLTIPLFGQSISKSDYERAVSFMYDNYNNKTVFNLNPRVKWFEDDSGLYFHEYSPEGKRFKEFDFETNKVKDLFDHKKLAKSLSKLHDTIVEPYDIGIYDIQKKEKNKLSFDSKGKSYVISLKSYKIEEHTKPFEQENNRLEVQSPDKKWVAFAKEYNLYLRSSATSVEIPLTEDGVKDYEYANLYGWFDKMEGENGQRPQNFFASWSPDSKWLFTYQWDTRNAEKMYLLDWSKDHLFKPRVLSYYRGSPGDTNMVMLRPVIFNIETMEEVKLDLPTHTHINSVNLSWSEKNGEAYASYSERGYQKEYVKHIDLKAPKVTTLIEETSETNIDNFSYRPLDSIQKVVFLSERSGWRQMYVYDLRKKAIDAVTHGNYYIHRIVYVDETDEIVYFEASGKEEGMNPYHRMIYSASLKNGKVRLLTVERMNHEVQFDKRGKYFVDNMSDINTPTQSVVRNVRSGEILATLTKADVTSLLATGWNSPEVFTYTAKDGKTICYGALWKPIGWDADKMYPIIDHSYTGPHTQVFPRSFSRALSNQALAELGFVVMMVDGLGSSGRSKEFHDYSYKNMGDNLKDHTLAIEHLGNTRTWIDTSKVGIFGHSAGGYDAGHGMLAFPEVYKVGVASSADHDFRMEKAWWPEMYMGWPVDKSYHEVSNITMAKNLKGKLLITHGALDDNVNPSATFKLAEALIRADKQFDLLILPSQRHGYTGDFRKYFIKKRWNYFVEHLLEQEPIWEFEWE